MKPKTEEEIIAQKCHEMFNPTIMASFTFEQKREIMNVIKRLSPAAIKRHSVRINITFWFIKKWFLLVLMGPDTRGGKRETPYQQQRTVVGMFMNLVFYVILLLGVLAMLFLLLYFGKTMLGIDLIPGVHLQDIIHW